jgi:hypothetical protein
MLLPMPMPYATSDTNINHATDDDDDDDDKVERETMHKKHSCAKLANQDISEDLKTSDETTSCKNQCPHGHKRTIYTSEELVSAVCPLCLHDAVKEPYMQPVPVASVAVDVSKQTFNVTWKGTELK